ncbi:imelysin family protein [Pontibacter cellulosilyticus]|uniref:Imelysin family protein n=1 Tax=Pontibacter cellulosilyticus TaxID=1720253 RepID=A0A923SKM7_9BACT|nr:imelysin family protein [Pontibacter cellulosilyticus]MBC5994912.1 imelysin family protein [Pontibacter cellulosilyticus]
MKALRNYTLAILAGFTMLTACDSDGDSGPKTEYDRQAMLANYADNLIVPGYEKFKTETTELSTAVSAFTASPSEATLANARKEYLDAYKVWQDVMTYEFGPADDQMLRSNLNIYPTNASKIESNVSAGSYDLQAAANIDAKGFPALDYLLYGKPTDAEVTALYTSDANAAKRKKYLQDLANLIKQRAEATYNSWTTANYATTFKESAGTAVGSAVGNLVNQLNFEIDLTKRAKVGIPSGRQSANIARPETVEAYYSKNSLELLKRALMAQKAIFMGVSTSGTNGPGLDDYLDHVDAKYNNMLLSDAIEAQFDAAIAAIDGVTVPLSQAVTSNPQAVSKLYEELQKLIVLTKTDMPSALGVAITYNDNDGD